MLIRNKGWLLLLGFTACQPASQSTPEELKAGIRRVEEDFSRMAAEKSIADAFYYYAADSAVIKRGNDSLIYGRNGIRNFYYTPGFKNVALSWSPDFIEVSAKGDLAYTYGKYTWQSKDSSGRVNEYKGIFHTVWKLQQDGSWKYVWD